jgi:hypothetical protein
MIDSLTRWLFFGGQIISLTGTWMQNIAQDWLVSVLQLIYAFLYYYLLAHLDQNRYSIDGMRKG